MKVTKYDGRAYFKQREFDKEGLFISLPFARSLNDPQHHRDIRREFHDFDTYRRELNEIEDFISYLEDEVEMDEKDTGFDLPLPDSQNEYFLIFNDKIWVYIRIYDEYMGFSDSSSGLCIDGIVVPEGTSIEEIREVKEWLLKGGFELMN